MQTQFQKQWKRWLALQKNKYVYFPSTYVDRLPNHTSNVYKPASGRLEWTAHPNGSKMLVIYKPMPLNMLVLCSGNPNQNEARSFCTLHETNKQRNKQTNNIPTLHIYHEWFKDWDVYFFCICLIPELSASETKPTLSRSKGDTLVLHFAWNKETNKHTNNIPNEWFKKWYVWFFSLYLFATRTIASWAWLELHGNTMSIRRKLRPPFPKLPSRHSLGHHDGSMSLGPQLVWGCQELDVWWHMLGFCKALPVPQGHELENSLFPKTKPSLAWHLETYLPHNYGRN